MNLNKVAALGIGYKAMRDLAEKIASQARLREVENFALIIEALGGTVIPQSSQQWSAPEANSIEIHGNRNFTIYMPSSGTEMEKLIYATALCHYLLHSLEGKHPLYVPRFEQSLANLEGLWFALAILLPDHTFELTSQNTTSTTKTLSEIFKVPEPIVILKRKILDNQKRAEISALSA